MRSRILATSMLFGLLTGLSALAHAQTPSNRAYALEDESTFETGCFWSCACPIQPSPVQGTFTLTHESWDGLYTHYRVSDVEWLVPERGNLTLRGSGTYRVGGEFAIRHQLVLDLEVGELAPRRFDSGLVTGGAEFPRILIDVPLNGPPACLDTVLSLSSAPVVLSADDVDPFASPWVRPNPFASTTELGFTLAAPGSVDVTVYDLSGRRIRTLEQGAWLAAGPHRRQWDGRRDDGTECAAGVYRVRVRTLQREHVRAFVKLP
ncbi:MAG TPA: FlgD immunoglobulin-like domain containing protein [Candidatus Limnocylindria bacterium]|nr:FlgD immunoglobulin-like domain containing protein [Candidatus Limnocylindria bacterium]